MQRTDCDSTRSSKATKAFFVTEERVKLFRNDVIKKEDYDHSTRNVPFNEAVTVLVSGESSILFVVALLKVIIMSWTERSKKGLFLMNRATLCRSIIALRQRSHSQRNLFDDQEIDDLNSSNKKDHRRSLRSLPRMSNGSNCGLRFALLGARRANTHLNHSIWICLRASGMTIDLQDQFLVGFSVLPAQI